MTRTRSSLWSMLAALAFITVASVSIARADTVTYNGGEFGLFLTGQNGNTYYFQYTADFTNWTSTTQQYIDAINFGTGGNPDIVGAPLLTSFSSSEGYAGNWTISVTNATNSGCSGGSANEVCAQSDPTDAFLTKGTYEWNFAVTYDGPLSASNLVDAPFRAWFGPVETNPQGKPLGKGLMSTNVDITVPEPATMAMICMGVLGIVACRRKLLSR